MSISTRMHPMSQLATCAQFSELATWEGVGVLTGVHTYVFCRNCKSNASTFNLGGCWGPDRSTYVFCRNCKSNVSTCNLGGCWGPDRSTYIRVFSTCIHSLFLLQSLDFDLILQKFELPVSHVTLSVAFDSLTFQLFFQNQILVFQLLGH